MPLEWKILQRACEYNTKENKQLNFKTPAILDKTNTKLFGYLVKTKLSWPLSLFLPLHFQHLRGQSCSPWRRKTGAVKGRAKEKWCSKPLAPSTPLNGTGERLQFKMSFKMLTIKSTRHFNLWIKSFLWVKDVYDRKVITKAIGYLLYFTQGPGKNKFRENELKCTCPGGPARRAETKPCFLISPWILLVQ